jgi:hypothetical protein
MRRLPSLVAADWLLLIQAGIVVATARAALSTVGLRRARTIVRVAARAAGVASPSRAAWAVRAVSRRITGATCLTQALALQAMLARAGHPCHVQIGVAKAESFEAHAWVVCGANVVIGGDQAAKFQSVVTLDR